MASPPTGRDGRVYNNHGRSAAAGETRQRIIDAAKTLVHDSAVWDWSAVTIVDVARIAEVSERTVYRHFVNEHGLRQAVMDDLQTGAGIRIDEIELSEVSVVARQIFEQLRDYQFEPRAALDPVLASVFERQKRSLIAAIADTTASDTPERSVLQAAAVLDLFWSADVFTRLSSVWGLESNEAANAATWAIDTLVDALKNGNHP